MKQTTDPDGAPTAYPQRRPAPISLADLARRVGCHRSTITRAVQGPLKAALLRGGRLDAGHPLLVAWTRARTATPEPCKGCGTGAAARYDGTPIEEFAARAEVSVTTVQAAVRGELGAALRDDGRLDLAHPAALTFLARYPLARDDDDAPLDPAISGHDFVCPACIDENRIDLEHPVFLAFLARYHSRVPTPADASEFANP